MRLNKYLFDLIVQSLVIVAVILIFKIITERRVAAVIAGSLFVFIPLWRSRIEYSINQFKIWIWWVGIIQFMALFALPIFIGRILYWSEDFENISIFGLHLSQMHHWSNLSYLLMMLTTSLGYWMSRQVVQNHK